jgi:glucokinase
MKVISVRSGSKAEFACTARNEASPNPTVRMRVKGQTNMMILAGDVGGTKTNLAFFELQNDRLVVVADARYASREHATFDELVIRFQHDHPFRADFACFGIAGPCRNGHCKAMNLPWIVEAERLRMQLNVGDVFVINDLEATAYAIPVLSSNEFAVIQHGVDDGRANAAVIAAGTGLGEAGLFWDGQRHRPFASEGGHSDFAPNNDLEAGLFAFLKNEFGHVGWERVLSGPGLHNLFCYLVRTRIAAPSAAVTDEMLKLDPASVISRAALEQTCPACIAALNLFVSMYGAEAGNLCLKLMASGGLYIGGGIAPKILPALKSGLFTAAFADKGRLRPVLEQIPVRVILTDKAALIGAAQCARLLGQA